MLTSILHPFTTSSDHDKHEPNFFEYQSLRLVRNMFVVPSGLRYECGSEILISNPKQSETCLTESTMPWLYCFEAFPRLSGHPLQSVLKNPLLSPSGIYIWHKWKALWRNTWLVKSVFNGGSSPYREVRTLEKEPGASESAGWKRP